MAGQYRDVGLVKGDVRQLRIPARVLLVIDQPVLARDVAVALGQGSCVTRTAQAAEAMAALRQWRPHLAVIDVDGEGGRVLDRLTPGTIGTRQLPVIALTRRGDLNTKLAAFERGVDDILTVPFFPEELVARAVAVTRRAYSEAVAFAPTIRLGGLEIDIRHRRVRAGDNELRLTSLEQGLIYLLAANAGRLLTRDEIQDHLWGVDYAAESNVVDRHICNLRKKLLNCGTRSRYIATVHGKGYRFVDVTAAGNLRPRSGRSLGSPSSP